MLVKPSRTQQTEVGLNCPLEVALAAVKQCPWVLEFASEELQNDPELKKLAEG